MQIVKIIKDRGICGTKNIPDKTIVLTVEKDPQIKDIETLRFRPGTITLVLMPGQVWDKREEAFNKLLLECEPVGESAQEKNIVIIPTENMLISFKATEQMDIETITKSLKELPAYFSDYYYDLKRLSYIHEVPVIVCMAATASDIQALLLMSRGSFHIPCNLLNIVEACDRVLLYNE